MFYFYADLHLKMVPYWIPHINLVISTISQFSRELEIGIPGKQQTDPTLHL